MQSRRLPNKCLQVTLQTVKKPTLKMKFVQININRSRYAHDMALSTAKQLDADVLLITEPNKNTLLKRKDWIKDEELATAINILNNHSVVNK